MPVVARFTLTITVPPGTAPNTNYLHLYTTDNDTDYHHVPLSAGSNCIPWVVTLGARNRDQRLPRTELSLVVLLRQVVKNEHNQPYLNTEGMARIPFSAFSSDAPFERTLFHRGSTVEYSSGRVKAWTFEVAVHGHQLLREYAQGIRAQHPETAKDLDPQDVNTLVNKRVTQCYDFDYSFGRVPSYPDVKRTLYPCYYIPEYVAEGWVLYQGCGNQFTAHANLPFVKTVINAAAVVTCGYTFGTHASTFALNSIKKRIYDTKLQIEFLSRILSLVPNFSIYATDRGSATFSWDTRTRNSKRNVFESADGLLTSAAYSHPAGDCEDMAQAVLGMHTALCTSAELNALIPVTCIFARMYKASAVLVLMREGMAEGWSHMTTRLVPQKNAEGFDRTPLWPLLVDGIYPFLSVFTTKQEVSPHEAITARISRIMFETKTLSGQWTGSPVSSMEKEEFTHLITSDRVIVFIRYFNDLLGGFKIHQESDTESGNESEEEEHGNTRKTNYRKVPGVSVDDAFTESIAHKVGNVEEIGVDTATMAEDPDNITYKKDTIAKRPDAMAAAGMARFRHPTVVIKPTEVMIIPADIIELGTKDPRHTTGPGSMDHVIMMYVDHDGIRDRLRKIYNQKTFEDMKQHSGVYYIQVVPISISSHIKAWVARLEFRKKTPRMAFNLAL